MPPAVILPLWFLGKSLNFGNSSPPAVIFLCVSLVETMNFDFSPPAVIFLSVSLVKSPNRKFLASGGAFSFVLP